MDIEVITINKSGTLPQLPTTTNSIKIWGYGIDNNLSKNKGSLILSEFELNKKTTLYKWLFSETIFAVHSFTKTINQRYKYIYYYANTAPIIK